MGSYSKDEPVKLVPPETLPDADRLPLPEAEADRLDRLLALPLLIEESSEPEREYPEILIEESSEPEGESSERLADSD